jgi:hypothetical protein
MASWALLWNLGTTAAQQAFPETLSPERPLTHVGALVGYIVYSVVVSGIAGFITAAIGRGSMGLVWILALVHLALGIIAEISYWHLLPVCYHVLFLLLVVPSTIAGGRVTSARQPRQLG